MSQVIMEQVRDLNWNVPANKNERSTTTSLSTTQNGTCGRFHKALKKPRFGVLFDVDGVIARGANVIPAAQKMIKRLTDSDGEFRVPVAFVTNACNRSADKARAISNMLGIEVLPQNVIHSQSPLTVFKKFHHKHVLFVGQGAVHDIAKELGFTNICTMDDIKEHYPLLDMVDHDNRKKVVAGYIEKDFPRVEAIIAIGEPKRWETSLQLCIDLLKTNGKPNHAPDVIPEQQLPFIACNMDLQFMAEACMPRFGHGAFLVCLEALYKKITGRELHYTSLIGKPSEITYRYAEHVLNKEAKRLGITEPLKRIYFVGDNDEVDIAGVNLYQIYINQIHARRSSPISDSSSSSSSEEDDLDIPSSRCVPKEACFEPQTCERVHGLLVGTGVFKPCNNTTTGNNKPYHGHRDFDRNAELYRPTKFTEDVLGAVEYALEQEAKSSS